MKKTFYLIIFSMFLTVTLSQKLYSQIPPRTEGEVNPDSMTVQLARMFAKDVFEMNGVPYLQPTVEVMNATSNARFYNTAFVPKKVDSPYFRFGIHMMYGVVPDVKKFYSPTMPNDEFTYEGLEPGNISFEGANAVVKFKYGKITYNTTNGDYGLDITDPAGLYYYVLRGIFFDGIKSGDIVVPKESPTSLGPGQQSFDFPDSSGLAKLFNNLSIDLPGFPPFMGDTSIKISDLLPDDVKANIGNILKGFPTVFNLPEGGNMNYIFAGIPQLVIGSFMGTEMLIRFIPPVNMGSKIGKFAFWGLGLKHSISQYFNDSEEPDERYFDLAVQAVYQGTSLENTIGVVNSELSSNTSMWNFNIHGSKHIKDIVDIYTGFSYEMINIKSEYKYYLPIEIQWQLGLIDKRTNFYTNKEDPKYPGNPPNDKPTGSGKGKLKDPFGDTEYEHEGDQNPQTAKIELNDTNIKWTIGLARDIGPVRIFLDYSVSQFNIFTGGVSYTF